MLTLTPRLGLSRGGTVGIRLSADDLIIHCDPRNYRPGVDPLAELADFVSAPLRDAPAIRTGSGELYLFFSKPADLRIAGLSAYEGLDILSEGNFIIGPVPSHPTTLLDFKPEGDIRAVQMAPDYLLKMLEEAPYYDQFLDGPRVIESHELAVLLRVLDPRSYGRGKYANWILISAACHQATQGGGFCEWMDWCIRDPDYLDFDACVSLNETWKSFFAGGTCGATYRTLFRAVRLAGRTDLVAPLEARLGGVIDKPMLTAVQGSTYCHQFGEAALGWRKGFPRGEWRKFNPRYPGAAARSMRNVTPSGRSPSVRMARTHRP